MTKKAMQMPGEFSGQVVVVTGGASGIGAACCREFARLGGTVFVLDRNLAPAVELAEAIGGHALECDIGNDASVEAAARRAEADLEKVDVLVNCAGLVQGRADAYSMPMGKWDRIVQINQRGTYVCCLAFARGMLRRRRGAIVNIASLAGMRSMPLHAYAPAKAAVISMTQTLAAEWGASGVRVNAVSPGFTHTEGMKAALDQGVMQRSRLVGSAALQRLVEPAEVASAVAFLSSGSASAITGINLPVDCGWLASAGWDAYGGLPTGS